MRLLKVNAFVVNSKNLDPTKTTTLRKKMVSDVNARFSKLKSETVKYIENINENRFVFSTDTDKLKEFNVWFQSQLEYGILSISDITPWTDKYIFSAYKTATRQAGTMLKKANLNMIPVEQALNLPINKNSLELLYTRTYTALESITADISGQMSRILAGGFANGQNPNDIAREMAKSIKTITKKRARVMARTEIINAHANATLNNFEAAGLENVEIEPEWLTAGDACPICLALAQKTYTIESARGLIPAHPNCRCAWKPKVIRE